MKGRKEFERKQRHAQKKGNRYNVFSVNDVRNEISVLPPLGGPSAMGGMGIRKMPGLPPPPDMGRAQMPGSMPGLAPLDGFGGGAVFNGRRPQRLAPIDQHVRSQQATKLPAITDPGSRMPSLPPMGPPDGGRGLKPMGVR